MNFIWLAWIFSVPLLVASEKTFTDVHLEIALSLASHFRIAYCVIGKTDEGSDLGLITSPTFLPKNTLLTSCLNFQEISEFISGNSNLKHGGKTMIILMADNSTLNYLKQLSRNESLSNVIWILFSEAYFHSELFEDIYVPFDCEFIYITRNFSVFSLTEIYQIGKRSEMETYDFGYWTKEKGLVVAGIHFYFRRNNLKGHRFKAIIKNNPPYVSIERDAEGNAKFKGYLYEIWSELEFRLNFRTDFPEGYFDKDPDKILQSEEVDFALARVSLVPSAFDSMDFSQPVHEAKSFLFGHRPGSELDWDSYLKPFSPNTWFISIVWMFSSSFALAFLYRKAWNCGTSEREANYYVFTFSEAVLTVFRAICMQGSDVTPKSNSCRLFFLSIYLTALVVTSAFSAALFSLLTIPKPRSPFSDLEEVLNSNKFQLGFPPDPDFHKLVEDFSTTLILPSQIKLKEKLAKFKNSLPETPQQGIEKICQNKFYIFMFDLPDVLYLMQNISRSCQDKILPSGPSLFTEFIGFGFSKKNPYKELINFHLIRMKNEGILKRLLVNYWPPQIPSVQATWVRVTLSDISPILYMFALGMVLGVIFLHAEKISFHLKKKNKRKFNIKVAKISNQFLPNKDTFGYGSSKSSPHEWDIRKIYRI